VPPRVKYVAGEAIDVIPEEKKVGLYHSSIYCKRLILMVLKRRDPLVSHPLLFPSPKEKNAM